MNAVFGSWVIIYCYHVLVQIRFSVCSCPDQVFCMFLSRSGFHHVIGSCPDQLVCLLCSFPDQVFFIMFLSRSSGHSIIFLTTTGDHSVMFLFTSGGHSVMFYPSKRWSCCHFCCCLDHMFIVTVTFNSSGLGREAGDVWCLTPVWNLRAVIWFPFPISSHVFSA